MVIFFYFSLISGAHNQIMYGLKTVKKRFTLFFEKFMSIMCSHVTGRSVNSQNGSYGGGPYPCHFLRHLVPHSQNGSYGGVPHSCHFLRHLVPHSQNGSYGGVPYSCHFLRHL